MSWFSNGLIVGLLGLVFVGAPVSGVSAGQQVGAAIIEKVDDGTLQSMIAAELKKNASLAPRDIAVSVKEGVATMTGAVRTTTDKARAGRLAKVPGIKRVDNRIEVNPNIDQSKIAAAGEKTKAGVAKATDATVNAVDHGKEGAQKVAGKTEEGVGKAADKTSEALGKVGDKLYDRSVTTRVKAGLSGEQLLHDTAIDVDTTDRVVTLRGTVASDAARARAVAIAGGIEGVTRVIDEVVVKEI
jgi:hyperosmotically inducible protein